MQASFYTKSKFSLKQPKKFGFVAEGEKIFQFLQKRQEKEKMFQFLAKKARKIENVSIFGKKGKNVILKAKKVLKVIFAKKVKRYVFIFLPFFLALVITNHLSLDSEKERQTL